jgi:hypothetical protein
MSFHTYINPVLFCTIQLYAIVTEFLFGVVDIEPNIAEFYYNM